MLRFEGILNHLSKEEHENLCSIIADCDVALSTFSNAIKQLTVDSKNITVRSYFASTHCNYVEYQILIL